MKNSNLFSKIFNNFQYDDFISIKKFYDFTKSIYNNKELNRRSGKKYISHIDDILNISLNKYEIYDSNITKIIIGHDILEENEKLYIKSNKKKGFKTGDLENKLLNYINKFELNGIQYLTHDEDITKLAKVSKIIQSENSKYILVKTFDILANINDHPENLKLKSKLNKIYQIDLIYDYFKNYKLDKNEMKFIKKEKIEKLKKEIETTRGELFKLIIDEI